MSAASPMLLPLVVAGCIDHQEADRIQHHLQGREVPDSTWALQEEIEEVLGRRLDGR